MWNVNYKVVQAKKSGDRTKWLQVGTAFKREDKFSMVLDTYPIPNSEGQVWLQLYERIEDEISQKNVEGQKQEAVHEKSYGGTAK